MIAILVKLTEEHSMALVGVAVSICLVTAWLFVTLLERAAIAGEALRLHWAASAAVVLGLGVWATHFIAALGFRPDFALSFDPSITAGSAMVGVAAVGVPASATVFVEKPGWKLLGGSSAGCGIVGMHITGISALTTCIVRLPISEMASIAVIGAMLFCAAFYAFNRGCRWLMIALVASAVGIVHFGLVAGSEVIPYENQVAGMDRNILSLMTGTVSLCLLLTAAVVVNSSAKFAEQMRQKVLLTTALTNMSNGLLLIGADDRIELFNNRVLELFGLEPSAIMVGMRWQRYLKNLAVPLGWSAHRLNRVIANHERWFARTSTTYIEHALDDGRILSVACRPVGSGGAVLTYDDVTAERQAQKEVERLAFLDPLTELPNRRTFQNILKRTFEEQSEASLLLIDLDLFKIVNDTLGHAAGDQLLTEVGHRLAAICLDGEHVARMAGDEFAVISPSADTMRTAALSEAIIATLSKSYEIGDRRVTIGCSVGTASTVDATSAECMVQFADLALYQAKSMGRGCSCVYEPGMQEAVLQRSQLEAELRTALDEGQFSLMYQPIVALHDQTIIGFEALIRWHHPAKGLVPPTDFIPIAEETGLICELGLWIAREACQQVSRWADPIYIAINVSPVQFRDGTFPDQLMAMLNEAGIAPARIEIELTETALIGDNVQIAQSLRTLRANGIRVAMDDFGTGYSSFAHLRDFDLDWIKIDQSFVRSAPTDPGSAAVLQAIIHMARGLGVGTIGEGVETSEQLSVLTDAGCLAAQGYLLGRPVTSENISLLIETEMATEKLS
jgi:diguanylate cyclase (GGDEF)-like protein